MAEENQKYLNSYVFTGLTAMLRDFNIDGELAKVTCTEVVTALRYASERIESEIPLDFTGRQ